MAIPFAPYAGLVQQRIEQHYHIGVVTSDIPDPLTGDLNGIEIHIDYAVTPEQRLFLLAHLFGHTVQWNVNPGGFALGQQYLPPVDACLFPQISAYETEAARYGLSLLHETSIHDVDPSADVLVRPVIRPRTLLTISQTRVPHPLVLWMRFLTS